MENKAPDVIYVPRYTCVYDSVVQTVVAKRQIEDDDETYHHQRVVDDLQAKLSAAEAKCERLREALRLYGECRAYCNSTITYPHSCDCGLDKALRDCGEGE